MWMLLPIIWPLLPLAFIQMKVEEFLAPVIELYNKAKDSLGESIDLDWIF